MRVPKMLGQPMSMKSPEKHFDINTTHGISGDNISGIPRVFMPYIGGMPSYVEKCDTVAANGDERFKISC